jgi:hypothetical protein
MPKFETDLKKAAKLLEGAGVIVAAVQSVLTDGGGEWIDDAWDAAQKIVAKQLKLRDTGDALEHSFVIVTSMRLNEARKGGPLLLQFCLQPAVKPAVKRALANVYGKRFVWSGSDSDVLVIKA